MRQYTASSRRHKAVQEASEAVCRSEASEAVQGAIQEL